MNMSQEIKAGKRFYLPSIENRKLLQVFLANSDLLERPRLLPFIHDKLKVCPEILFIGYNPSYSKTGIERFVRKANLKFPAPLLKMHQLTSGWKYRRSILSVQQAARERYDYFRPFKEIAEGLTGDLNEWEHLDILSVRASDQKVLSASVRKSRNAAAWRFYQAQFEITWKLITAIQPKRILVANVDATLLFEEQYRHNIVAEYNSKDRHGLIRIGKETIPYYFTGHLGNGLMNRYYKDLILHTLRGKVRKS
jgi:hypothetical protein